MPDPLLEEDLPLLSSQVFRNELILSKILSFLDFENLVRCRIVNQLWNENAIPHLHKTSFLGLLRLEKYFNVGVEEATEILKNFHHPNIRVTGEQGIHHLATNEEFKGSILPWVQVLDINIKGDEQLGFFQEIMGQVAPRVTKLCFSSGMNGDEVKDGGIFHPSCSPAVIFFPHLKSVSINMGKNGFDKGPEFLEELFTAAPNLTEIFLNGTVVSTPDLVEVVENKFPRLLKQITNLTLGPPKSYQDFENGCGILQQFKGLKCLSVNGIKLDGRWTDEYDWKAYISKFALLSSPSLTTLKLDFIITHYEPYSCPLYFPHSPNLERLRISNWIIGGDIDDDVEFGGAKMKVGFKDEKGNHLDVINYEKCFPNLKELMLTNSLYKGMLEGDPFWKGFLPPQGGVVCKTLRNLYISWAECECFEGNVDLGMNTQNPELKERIISIFPNAKIFVGGEYFDKTK